jgi:hypothetical protein
MKNKNGLSVYIDSLWLAVGELAVALLVFLGFLIAKAAGAEVTLYKAVTGALLGGAVTVANFLILSVGINRAINRFVDERGTDEMDDETAEKYAKERVKATSFGMNGSELNVETKLYFNNVGRMRVEVSVSQECNILFDGALIGLGLMDERLTFSAHAAAECLDITGYAGHVHFFNYVGKKAEDLGVATDLINGIISTVNNIKDTIAIFYK